MKYKGMHRVTILLIIMMAHLCTIVTVQAINIKPVSEIKMSGIERQTKDYSCGAAALSILLTLYFGDSIEEMDILSDIVYRLNKEQTVESMTKGFSMYDLKMAAERLGYMASGIKLSAKSASKLKGPIIILLKDEGFNHFVILKGITQGRAFITDPAKGHYRIQLYDLLKTWEGESLVVGYDGFGLPSFHGLNHPYGADVAPERYTVRTLQNTTLN